MNLLDKLQDEISSLPGIGKRSARRLMFHFLSMGQEDFERFLRVLEKTRGTIRPCKQCFNYAEEELCSICQSNRRDTSLICVVERPQDLFALEAAHTYFGHYHVLGGVISPMREIGPEHLRIRELEERIVKGNYKELILALNSSIESEATRLYLKELFSSKVKISELSRGMPAGGELEYVDKMTLQRAIEERRFNDW